VPTLATVEQFEEEESITVAREHRRLVHAAGEDVEQAVSEHRARYARHPLTVERRSAEDSMWIDFRCFGARQCQALRGVER
jgi:hypothetical protein